MKINRRERAANRRARERIAGSLTRELDAIFDRFRIQGLNRTRLGQALQSGAGVGAINNPATGFPQLAAQLEVAVAESIEAAIADGMRIGEQFGTIAPTVDRAVIQDVALKYVNRPATQLGLRAIKNLDGVRNGLTGILRAETSIPRATMQIAEHIGLTPHQSNRVLAFRRRLESVRLTTPLGDTPALRAGIDAEVERMSARLRLNRARAIAEDQTQRAIQAGERAFWDEGVKSGEVDGEKVVKRWFTLRDDAVCPICEPLDGQVVPIQGSFGEFDEPPAHFLCRCYLEYRDVSADLPTGAVAAL